MRLQIPEGIGWVPNFGRRPYIRVTPSRFGETEDASEIINTFLEMFVEPMKVWEEILKDLKTEQSGQHLHRDQGAGNDWGDIEYGPVECVISEYHTRSTTIYLEDLITILEQALEYLEAHPPESP